MKEHEQRREINNINEMEYMFYRKNHLSAASNNILISNKINNEE